MTTNQPPRRAASDPVMAIIAASWENKLSLTRAICARFVPSARLKGYEFEDLLQHSFLVYPKFYHSFSADKRVPEDAYWGFCLKRAFIDIVRKPRLALIEELDDLAVVSAGEPISWLEEGLEILAKRDPKSRVKIEAFRLHHLEGRTLTDLSAKEFSGKSIPTLSRWVGQIEKELSKLYDKDGNPDLG
jgi:hypothetical protein